MSKYLFGVKWKLDNAIQEGTYMPAAGNVFQVRLKPAHLRWGTLGQSRQSNPRSRLEAYVQIPLPYARAFTILPGSVFNGRSSDGFFNATVKASGSTGTPKRAKQFQGNGDLKLFGRWFQHVNAQPGDIIQVEFTSPTDVVFTKI